jgi:hypothetical protein
VHVAALREVVKEVTCVAEADLPRQHTTCHTSWAEKAAVYSMKIVLRVERMRSLVL